MATSSSHPQPTVPSPYLTGKGERAKNSPGSRKTNKRTKVKENKGGTQMSQHLEEASGLQALQSQAASSGLFPEQRAVKVGGRGLSQGWGSMPVHPRGRAGGVAARPLGARMSRAFQRKPGSVLWVSIFLLVRFEIGKNLLKGNLARDHRSL